MSEAKGDNPPPLVERWLQEQQQWQRTILGYLDSMVKNEEFLVHLGNAMRGSLLAGKPYPGVAVPPATEEAAQPVPDDRLDQLLFAIHQLQGQVQDLSMTLDEVRKDLRTLTAVAPAVPRGRKATPAKTTPAKATPAKATSKTRSARVGPKGSW